MSDSAFDPMPALTEEQARKLQWLLLGFGMSRSQADQIIARMRS